MPNLAMGFNGDGLAPALEKGRRKQKAPIDAGDGDPDLDPPEVRAVAKQKVASQGREPIAGCEPEDFSPLSPFFHPSWPEELAPEALHGIAGDFVRAIEPASEADPVALSASYGGPTDEGYHGEAEVWTHEGDVVRSEWASWGRDCDGRQEAGGEHVCPLGKLRARDMVEALDVPENRGIFAPEWERADAWQRDHSAEAAGY